MADQNPKITYVEAPVDVLDEALMMLKGADLLREAAGREDFSLARSLLQDGAYERLESFRPLLEAEPPASRG